MKEEKKSPDEQKKELHVAAFVDILGFSEKMKDAKDDLEKLEVIEDELQTFYEVYSSYISTELDPTFAWGQIQTFSDCAYISVPVVPYTKDDSSTYDRVASTMEEIGSAQAELLLDYHIFLRGGIDYGVKVYRKNERGSVEVSSAYFSAYRIENEKNFPYPIVKVSERLATKLHNLPGAKYYGEAPGKDILWKVNNSEGKPTYFISYLQCLFDFGGEIFGDAQKISNVLYRHKSALIEAFNAYKKDSHIASKYSFLAHKYHNEYVKWKSSEYNLGEIEPLLIQKSDVPLLETFEEQIVED